LGFAFLFPIPDRGTYFINLTNNYSRGVPVDCIIDYWFYFDAFEKHFSCKIAGPAT